MKVKVKRTNVIVHKISENELNERFGVMVLRLIILTS